ncbi:hypothetical protein [Alicyclobacillus fastidiosus]|uniref:Uncharacterized protein n=1 Tax=Alicyclobacillus fastidiosus TaxID=392011 RepID=A0ABV5ALT1_9BACL|nr:hypothetical protein [Alicyclobacillus fastidiosus]WEH11094.1 hypothetical protein PYS47_07715 [Alicyclobacillus fastidiosus]
MLEYSEGTLQYIRDMIDKHVEALERVDRESIIARLNSLESRIAEVEKLFSWLDAHISQSRTLL